MQLKFLFLKNKFTQALLMYFSQRHTKKKTLLMLCLILLLFLIGSLLLFNGSPFAFINFFI